MPTPRPRTLALGATIVATAAFLLVGSSDSLALRIVPLVLAFVAFGSVVVLARQGRGPSTRAVMGSSVILLGLAVAVAPMHSQDVYLYGMQGRIVTTHHANPYLVAPGAFPDDPLFEYVAAPWHEVRSYYGPAFTAAEAGVAAAAGPSPLAVRLLFQLVSAGAVVAALALLRRAGVGAGGLALVGLNPVVVAKGVNEGHVDVLLGLLLLAAVLAARRRPLVAAVLLGVAGLVKPIALVAGLGLVVWLVTRRGWAVAARAGLLSGGLVVLGYLAVGGREALEPLREAGLQQSRSSLWARPRLALTEALIGRGASGTEAGEAARQAVAAMSLILVVVLVGAVMVLVFRRRDARTAPDPALAVSAVFLAYFLAGVYTPAWYLSAALPVAALCWRSRTAALLVVQGALLSVAYVYSRDLGDDPLVASVRAFSSWLVPAFQAVVVLAILVRAAAALAEERGWRAAGTWPDRMGRARRARL